MSEERAPSRWWALGALIPWSLFLATGAAAPDGSYLTRLYFAGTPERWVAAAAGGPDGARAALLTDLAFASSFAVVGYLLLRAGHRYWAPERRRGDRWIWRHMPVIAVAAGALDLIETSGQLLWLDALAPPSFVTHAIAAIAWWKWLAYVVALVGVFGLVIGPAVAPVVRPTMRALSRLIDRREPPEPERPPARAATEPRTADGRTLGITASGGGIRSAAVMAGVFRGLTASGAFGQARWLHAVSGGGFTAAGWRASSRVRDEVDLFGADHPWYRTVRHRRRYLDNGVGSLLGGVVNVLVRLVVVLGTIVWAAMLVGWVVGWLTRTWAVLPGFSNDPDAATPVDSILTWRLLVPGAVPLVVAGVAFVMIHANRREEWRNRLRSVAVVAALVGALLLGLLVAVPLGLRLGRPALELLPGIGTGDDDAEGGAGLLGVLSALGLIAAVQRVLTAEVKKRWSRLGGVLLAVGLFALAGKVADDQANLDPDRFFAGDRVLVVGIVWLLVVNVIPSHRLTLNGVYRKRLGETFFLSAAADGDGALEPIGYFAEPDWQDYVTAPGPELVLCATAQSSRMQPGGVPAAGFSFGRRAMTIHNEGADPEHPGEHKAARSWMWSTFRSDDHALGSSWDGYPRRLSMSRAMALAGAAFSSAMGRQSYGSTNSLLSALNLRLGMWVPNPNRADWFVDRDRSPRVHLGYLAKELFNRYDLDDDAFVYVTDGGHRDNLGVVEQLRERPDRMIVLDASGDSPGGFGTMRGAMQLADSELGVEIELDWAPIEWKQVPDRDVPLDVVTRGTATWREREPGEQRTHVTEIIYAKAQVADSAPLSVRQFAGGDPAFPDYSTIDQFLSEAEWDALVDLGVHLADRINAVGGFEADPVARPHV